jgi:hypothetical protein
MVRHRTITAYDGEQVRSGSKLFEHPVEDLSINADRQHLIGIGLQKPHGPAQLGRNRNLAIVGYGGQSNTPSSGVRLPPSLSALLTLRLNLCHARTPIGT